MLIVWLWLISDSTTLINIWQPTTEHQQVPLNTFILSSFHLFIASKLQTSYSSITSLYCSFDQRCNGGSTSEWLGCSCEDDCYLELEPALFIHLYPHYSKHISFSMITWRFHYLWWSYNPRRKISLHIYSYFIAIMFIPHILYIHTKLFCYSIIKHNALYHILEILLRGWLWFVIIYLKWLGIWVNWSATYFSSANKVRFPTTPGEVSLNYRYYYPFDLCFTLYY